MSMNTQTCLIYYLVFVWMGRGGKYLLIFLTPNSYFESIWKLVGNGSYHLKFLIHFLRVEGNTLTDLALKFKWVWEQVAKFLLHLPCNFITRNVSFSKCCCEQTLLHFRADKQMEGEYFFEENPFLDFLLKLWVWNLSFLFLRVGFGKGELLTWWTGLLYGTVETCMAVSLVLPRVTFGYDHIIDLGTSDSCVILSALTES